MPFVMALITVGLLTVLLAACSPFEHENSFCGLETDKDKLFCYMGKQKPLNRRSEDIQYIYLSRESHQDMPLLLPKLYEASLNEGRYVAIGGYTQASIDIMARSIEYLRTSDRPLTGLLMQLFLPDKPEVHDIVTKLEREGITVEYFEIPEL